jgi:hypothetical protein
MVNTYSTIPGVADFCLLSDCKSKLVDQSLARFFVGMGWDGYGDRLGSKSRSLPCDKKHISLPGSKLRGEMVEGENHSLVLTSLLSRRFVSGM